MEESELEIDVKEEVEKIEEERDKSFSWMRYLSLSTVIIAVVAAVASLLSGSFSNEGLIEKNNSILYQNKASDQWNYYQAKGIKKNIADAFYQQSNNKSFKDQSTQYGNEQLDIQNKAKEFEKQVEESNTASEHFLEKHHKMAFAVTFFQIGIALSALSSLMKKRLFFIISLIFACLGIGFMVMGFVL